MKHVRNKQWDTKLGMRNDLFKVKEKLFLTRMALFKRFGVDTRYIGKTMNLDINSTLTSYEACRILYELYDRKNFFVKLVYRVIGFIKTRHVGLDKFRLDIL